MILVTAKEAGTNAKKIQRVMHADKALDLARSAMLSLEPMEETAADLKAMKFMREIVNGKVKAIVNLKNNNELVFQNHHENN